MPNTNTLRAVIETSSHNDTARTHTHTITARRMGPTHTLPPPCLAYHEASPGKRAVPRATFAPSMPSGTAIRNEASLREAHPEERFGITTLDRPAPTTHDEDELQMHGTTHTSTLQAATQHNGSMCGVRMTTPNDMNTFNNG